MPQLPNQQLPPYPQAKEGERGLNWASVAVVSSIIIFILIIAVFAYWFLVLRPQVESQPKDTSTPSTKETNSSEKPASPSAENDETEDWKTFTSDKIGYSIKLPANWLTTKGADNESCVDNMDFFAPSNDLLGLCATEFGGLGVVQKINQDFEDYIENIIDTSTLKDSERTDATVGGAEAVRVSGTYNLTDDFNSLNGSKTISYYIDQDGNVLLITYLGKPSWPDHSETFELIITTLKFL
jgi:hypothetical protein